MSFWGEALPKLVDGHDALKPEIISYSHFLLLMLDTLMVHSLIFPNKYSVIDQANQGFKL